MVVAFPASRVTKLVYDAAGRLMEASEPNRPELNLPQSVIHRLEAHVFLRQQVAHVDPVMVPANAAVATDPAHFEMPRILERGQPPSVRSMTKSLKGP